MRRTSLLITGCLLACASASTAAAAMYNITDLGTLGGPFSYGYRINASGQVVGTASTDTISWNGYPEERAFLWTPTVPNGTSGTMHDLGTLGGNSGDYFSNGFGINDTGQVVGRTSTSNEDSSWSAFRWTPSVPNGTNGTMHDLGTLGGQSSVGVAINASGQVTGSAWTLGEPGEVGSHAFLHNGTMHDIETLGGQYSSGGSINARGQVTGRTQLNVDAPSRAFLYDGTMHDLGTFGGRETSGAGINASGQVTGSAWTADDSHAFLWTPTVPNGTSGTMHDLGTLGGSYSVATGINAKGQITGWAAPNGDAGNRAFLYDGIHGIVDLNSRIDPSSGWDLNYAEAINDRGQITGSGTIGGQEHAFLLTPSQTYAILVGSDDFGSFNAPNLIRGRLDVDHVAAQLSSWVPTDNLTILKYDYDEEATFASDILNAVLGVADKAQPGDTLIFFYAGHGSGGTATEDWINPNHGTEYQDDYLTLLLADARLTDVNKWVLLDSCHAEGFWNNDSESDFDLETLDNIMFLGAAEEAGLSYSSPIDGSGYFTSAILNALSPDATFGTLLAAAQDASHDTVTGYLRDEGFGTGHWNPVGYVSSDFDLRRTLDGALSVPEPSTAALAAMGVIGLATVARRLRKVR